MNSKITALRYWALLCFAAGVALVAACGGGSNGSSSSSSEPPLAPETTAYEAQTSVKLGFTASATGAGAAPLRFELAAAPDGVLIDQQSGSVEWVPQSEQLGDHTIAVSITAADGAVTTKSYRINVATPEGLAPYLVLRTDAAGYSRGQPIGADWQVGGDMPANASIQLRVHAPAVDAAAADPSQLTWMLDAQGGWSDAEVALQSAVRKGQTRLTLPNSVTGSWLVETRLVDAGGAVLATAVVRVLVSDIPALRLSLNRPIANPLDRVRAQIDVAAGTNPLPVRLVAWLVKPDGSVVGLPRMEVADLEVTRSDIATGTYPLLDREFTAAESGEYRIHSRLYAAADGRLLQEASRKFSVCAAQGTVSGRVSRPDRLPLDGVAATVATVQALNLADGSVSASAEISAQGDYALTLEAGRYLLLARVIEAASARLEAESPLILVGCSATGATHDLTLRAR